MQMLQLLTYLLVSRLGDILARRETSVYSVAYNNSGDDSDGDAGDGESDDGDGSDKSYVLGQEGQCLTNNHG
jgi:hypothetical protein